MKTVRSCRNAMSCELCLFHPDCDRWYRILTESARPGPRAASGSRTSGGAARRAGYRQWGISPRPETEFMPVIVAPPAAFEAPYAPPAVFLCENPGSHACRRATPVEGRHHVHKRTLHMNRRTVLYARQNAFFLPDFCFYAPSSVLIHFSCRAASGQAYNASLQCNRGKAVIWTLSAYSTRSMPSFGVRS